MTESTHGMALVRRAAAEHRPVILTLVAGLAVNLVAYGIVVYPLAQRVANVTQRDSAAERALAQAKSEYEQASGTLSGKARASSELTTFYNDVLPKDLSGARRLTYLRLAQLARESNLRFESGSYKPEGARDSTLTRLKIELVLGGNYGDIRTFIHALESSPEFVVIDNVELAEEADGGNLVVTLELSTYYRSTAVS